MKDFRMQPRYQAKLKEKYDHCRPWRQRPVIRITCEACGHTFYRMWTGEDKYFPDTCGQADAITKKWKVRDAELVMRKRIDELLQAKAEAVNEIKRAESALADAAGKDASGESGLPADGHKESLAGRIRELKESVDAIGEMLDLFDIVSDDQLIGWVERGARLDDIPYKDYR